MKKWTKWIIGIILFPFVLFLLLLVLIYIPPVQNFVKDKAVGYASEALDMDVSIRRVTLSFPLSLVVKDACAKSGTDTLLSVERLVVDVKLWPLFRKQVDIDGVRLQKAQVNTGNMIDGIVVDGNIDNFYLKSHGVDLEKEEVVLNNLTLEDSRINLSLADTTASDTTSSEVRWKIIVKDVDIDNVAFNLAMPLDTMAMTSYVGSAVIRDGIVDLGRQSYMLNHFKLDNASFGMTTTNDSTALTFDPAHLLMTNVALEVDSVEFHDRRINALLRNIAMNERSGLAVTSGTAKITADSNYIYIRSMKLNTPSSSFDLEAMGGWTLLDTVPYGGIRLDAHMKIGLKDLEYFAGPLHENIPKESVVANLSVGGTLDRLSLNSFDVKWGKILSLKADGNVKAPLDSIKRSAELKMNLDVGNVAFVDSIYELTKSGLRIPSGLKIRTNVEYADNVCKADFMMREHKSRINLQAEYDVTRERYIASLNVDSLDLTHFIDIDSITPLNINLDVRGRHFDPYDKRMVASIQGYIDSFRYTDYDLSNTNLEGHLENGKGELQLDIDNPWIDMGTSLGLDISRHYSSASLAVNVRSIGLQKLMQASNPVTGSVNVNIDAYTDMNMMAGGTGRIGDIVFDTNGNKMRPKDITFEAYTNKDVSEFSVNAGDMFMTINGDEGATKLSGMLQAFSARLGEQLANHNLDYQELKQYLPDLYFEITADNDNPFANYLKVMNVDIGKTRVRVSMNPYRGVAGDLLFNDIKVDSIKLDSAYMWFVQDTASIRYRMNVVNNSNMRDFVSNAVVDGKITNTYADILIDMFNPRGEKGLYLGCRADFLVDGVKFSFFPEAPMFLFQPFRLNSGNYFYISSDNRIEADVSFINENDMGLSLQTSETKRGENRLTASLKGIELADIRALLPVLPEMSGILSADVSYTPLKKTYSLSADVKVDKFVYEKQPVADLYVSAGYVPFENDKQIVRLKVGVNGEEVASVGGKYDPNAEKKIAYRMSLKKLPLNIINPFVPDNLIKFAGTATGEVNLAGSFKEPVLNGNVVFEQTSVFIPQAGTTFRFDDRPLNVVDSRLVFDRFALFTRTDNPFTIDGNIDFSNLSDIGMDMKFITSNYELLNAKRTKESLVFGKAYIDANVTVNGKLDALQVRGFTRLLGNTNLTYINKESELSVQDRLGEMVTFVNFKDTISNKDIKIQPIRVSGMDVLLNVSIDQAAQINIYLSEVGDNKVEVAGGGDLSMKYSSLGELSLSGRYTFSKGKISYSLPLVNIADFSVREGGYIEWTRDVMNPSMNLSAVKVVRSDVPNSSGEGTHKSNFDISVNITNTLENLGLSFDVAAPEDADVQNELAAMSEEERSRLAISMLITGVYTGGTNFNMGSALNSLLQSEISSAVGKIKAVDLSLGMENPNGQEGFDNMDISYKISKRFLNDRFSIVIGGKISTGSNADESNKESFIDNISIEYRLDNSGTRYVKLFHNKNYESILEGEITETGAGIVLRKKMLKLGELFIFKRRENNEVKE